MKKINLTISMVVNDEAYETKVKPIMKDIQSGAFKREFMDDREDSQGISNFKASLTVDKDTIVTPSNQRMCREFTDVFSVDMENTRSNRVHQIKCLIEEVIELAFASDMTHVELSKAFAKSVQKIYGDNNEGSYSKEGILDALIDTEYFANHIKNMVGITENAFDTGFYRVHKANMDKLQPDGTVLRSDGTDGLPVGKVKKPEGWKPADLSDLV